MNYKCLDCNYEFKVVIQQHPHPINNFISVSSFGCPICLKAQAKAKICPNCSSTNVIQFIEKEGKEKDGKN